MAHDPQKLIIQATEWTPEIAAWIDQARGAASLLDLQAQAAAGGLYAVRAGAETVGAFLLRVERHAEGAEGVIVAAAARLDGVDMTASVVPAIERMFTGCASVRYHTRSPALARKMARLGYTGAEIVCTKKIEV